MRREVKTIMLAEMYNELVNGVLSALGDQVKRIVLYGSVARGTDQPNSDIDIAVFLTDCMNFEMEDRLSDVIVDLNLKYDRLFSVIDINDSVYTKWRNVNPFYQNVENEGITLWQAV